MQLRDLKAVKTVTVIGGGVIGAGWAAHFLARGFDVILYDLKAESAPASRQLVDAAWPIVERLGLTAGASRDRLSFTTDLEGSLKKTDFVQECAPDSRELKISLFARIDAALAPDVVLASSTSGIPMTVIQSKMTHPERAVVGHPFNPPYLIPLVEVVGGESTDPAVVDWAMSFYESIGKYALKLDKEVMGFVANRLQEAMWREALHMIAAGEATAEQIDAAVVQGPGLRWAIMGPCMTYHLAGGEGGIAHTLKHFGAALEEPWCRMQAPALTEKMQQVLAEGCDRLSRGRPVSELTPERDAAVIAILEALGKIPGSPATGK